MFSKHYSKLPPQSSSELGIYPWLLKARDQSSDKYAFETKHAGVSVKAQMPFFHAVCQPERKSLMFPFATSMPEWLCP